MSSYEALITTLALTIGTSWASGINLYAALLILGLGGASGNIALPNELSVLTNSFVIGASAAMYLIEFFADKIPGVDSIWDAAHTFFKYTKLFNQITLVAPSVIIFILNPNFLRSVE